MAMGSVKMDINSHFYTGFCPWQGMSRAISPSNSRQAIHYALADLYFLNMQIWKLHLQLHLNRFSSLIGCGSLITQKVNNSHILDNAILEKCLATSNSCED